MTKERFEFLKSHEEEAESELCEFIMEVLEREHDRLAHESNATGNKSLYWNALACDHAITYVRDWQNSL